MTPSEITSLFAAWFYFDGNYMADWAPLVGSILEEAGDLELLFCLLENTGWFGAQFTKGQLEAKFNEIANQAREDALVAAATRPPADVPVVLPVAEEKPKKRRRTKLEQAADGPIAAAVMGEAAPEEANPFR